MRIKGAVALYSFRFDFSSSEEQPGQKLTFVDLFSSSKPAQCVFQTKQGDVEASNNELYRDRSTKSDQLYVRDSIRTFIVDIWN